MTNDPRSEFGPELGWRKLPAEREAELRAWLAAHPQAQADWELESALTEALERLADVPVANNFTARVVEELRRDNGRRERERKDAARPAFWPWRARWLARAAVAAVVLSAGLLGVAHIREQHRVEEYRRSVTTVSEVASLPEPEILQDFDVIRVLDQRPAPDEELLKALQ